MKSILAVEDDPEVVKLLSILYNGPAYSFSSAYNGREGIKKALKKNFDLIILDLMLPDMDGMDICRELREKHINSAIMMLSSHSEEIDKVLAFELGADDYVTKPFAIRELMARSKALLRRTEQTRQAVAEKPEEITFRNLLIDKDKRKASISTKRLDLTSKEFDLLLLLAQNPGKTYSRQELLEKIWGYTFSGYEHTVTAHINRLRIKIENDLSSPEYILTSWGVGYRFAE